MITDAAGVQPGTVLAEGKTKRILQGFGHDDCTIVSKDDITAGDGAKHDVIEGKGALANLTTCNVFRLLRRHDVPVAFHQQTGDDTFSAPFCTMLPYEVVARRKAYGSYLKRRPELSKGHVFPDLVIEFFLKTNGRRWKEHELVCDDPLMQFNLVEGVIYLLDPAAPSKEARPFLTLAESEVFTQENEYALREQMKDITRKVFVILENAWREVGGNIVDFKIEFGMTADGRLLVADVIDNDSWRVLNDLGEHLDKQHYRQGGTLEEVLEKYQRVAELTSRF